ncbi:hypothetical protein GCM10010211_22110 [Streptomyces albospinus]|uniref:Uncharacterized protein n=1 Tax=Streptomyces albospinus TaxID=285515 RepID=A0ABQ2UW49_9ACTN|nr:hypothetical protein [Streptomyces albospinus]GGU56956.1 hypothetical protein GCM10010211_22110 [Streptomyces albospinus]
MRPSTLRALKRAAELTRQNRFTEAVLVAEPVLLTADLQESAEIRGWLIGHAAEFVAERETR